LNFKIFQPLKSGIKEERKMKKIITITLAIAMALSLAACKGNSTSVSSKKPTENSVNDTKNSSEATDGTTEPETSDETSTEGTDYFTGLQKGTYITFGTYEQYDGKKPLEWEVLDVDGDRALLVTKYVIDCAKYNDEREDVSWETCSLRKWLNGEFFDTAFSVEDQKKIKTVTLSNEGNKAYKTEASNDTNDRVFCLSLYELNKSFKFNKRSETGYCYSESLIIPATDYAKRDRLSARIISEGHYKSMDLDDEGYSKSVIGKEGAAWWIRTPAGSGDHACVVSFDGRTGLYAINYVDSYGIGVRPAIYVSVK